MIRAPERAHLVVRDGRVAPGQFRIVKTGDVLSHDMIEDGPQVALQERPLQGIADQSFSADADTRSRKHQAGSHDGRADRPVTQLLVEFPVDAARLRINSGDTARGAGENQLLPPVLCWMHAGCPQNLP